MPRDSVAGQLIAPCRRSRTLRAAAARWLRGSRRRKCGRRKPGADLRSSSRTGAARRGKTPARVSRRCGSVASSRPAIRTLARARRNDARDAAQRRRLARAVGPYETRHFAGAHGERQIADGGEIAIQLREAGNFDHAGDSDLAVATSWRDADTNGPAPWRASNSGGTAEARAGMAIAREAAQPQGGEGAARARADRIYFGAMALICGVTILGGFAPSFFLRSTLMGGAPALRPTVIAHGTLFTDLGRAVPHADGADQCATAAIASAPRSRGLGVAARWPRSASC